MASKILWVSKTTGELSITKVGEIPVSLSLADYYGNDWIPVKVID